ncbi:MAG: UPF0175 family protein [Halobacteria archaeon]|nr:UPF0175 family protein [Halobacteria archaeon]
MSDGPTVLDSTVLSNFAYIDDYRLLTDLPDVSTVPVVENEISDGVETHPYLRNAFDLLHKDIQVLTPFSDEISLEGYLIEKEGLDRGEAQVIAVAENREGVVVTDDGDARKVAKNRGIRLTGSIGVLIRGVKRNLVDKSTADKWLKSWVHDIGFRALSKDIGVIESGAVLAFELLDISVSRGAELAGLSEDEFTDLLEQYGISSIYGPDSVEELYEDVDIDE